MLAHEPRLQPASSGVFERISTPGTGEHVCRSSIPGGGLGSSLTISAALLGILTDEALHKGPYTAFPLQAWDAQTLCLSYAELPAMQSQSVSSGPCAPSTLFRGRGSPNR